METETDVIVVGAGPTGLMLANELAAAGVGVTIADHRASRSPQSKAGNLHPRSCEILDQRRLLAPIAEHATARLPTGHFAGLPVPLDFSVLPTRHRYQLLVEQARVEEELEASLGRSGVAVDREHRLTALEQDSARVTATLDTPSGPRRVRCTYLVGCDGARSTVRELLGVAFPGLPGRTGMVAADVTLSRIPRGADERRRHIGARFRFGSRSAAMLHPLSGGTYRLLFPAPRQDVAKDAPVEPAEVREVLADVYGDEAELDRLLIASRFTDASRQAERYRVGRAFLAGDAAHIHLPTGGQGMNLGLQDAFALGWRLAAAVRGHASDHLLGSYETERHPVAARVLDNTRAQGELGRVTTAPMQAMRELFVELVRLPEANRHLAGMVSGIDIRYPAPDDRSAAHPLTGRRAPDLDLDTAEGPARLTRLLRPGRGLLVEFTVDEPHYGDAAQRWSDRVDHLVAAPVDPVDATALLIRPDGHIAWAVDSNENRGDTPDASLRQWFGTPESN
ncbi:2-polyprenyl-6-methoxyphenol hydroxylase-like FAD-dependent oxidoreductase [Nocardiopsis mwathae]|uniref:2-polyprenyl-6-methoxyphenol hydroxylase-like FAD-dependent oxidoreductase n=1 Tax=Nocardiopsis mwathae TaxID=1472723 RepID=A0A7W9YGG9_9ACTN|nr:FAD-dependent monooxygenase [Nocardiopsis mwathae]MBB6171715.1 2-polyprenyl-6-methoxyphenol hydroxylase-like FAD-dependent oxidoreductase [Nocardiopsis mwathae]